jgi:elongation factor G
VAIEPKTKGDQEKLGVAIQKLAEEDPTFQVSRTTRPARRSSPGWASSTSTSWSTGCAAEFKVEANVGKPQVAYRETIRRPV